MENASNGRQICLPALKDSPERVCLFKIARKIGITLKQFNERIEMTNRSSTNPSNAMDALNNVLAQVQKLQAQASLTEPERVERLRLQAEVQSKQKELEAATQRLKSTVAIYDQTSERIRTIAEIARSLGTEMEALPSELQSQCSAVNEHLNGLAAKLGDLASSCNSDKASALEVVSQKRAELESAKAALQSDISKKRFSAEEALLDADNALSDAARVTSA